MGAGRHTGWATRLKAPARSRGVCIVLAALIGSGGTLAHEPLFMASHEAPGKGAFDMHLEVTSEQGETEYELQATWGFTRDVAVRVGVPFLAQASGFADPRVAVKWRFWDRDVLGGKYAVAALLETTLPLGEQGIGRDRPSVLVGVVHGREGLHHYYFLDARYAHSGADDGERPGDVLFLDGSYGWRPVLRPLDQTDVVLFFEVNWEDHVPERRGGVDPMSGGRFLSAAAEVLVSPSNRLMIRTGVQVPVSQRIPPGAPRRDARFRVATEFRFWRLPR